MNANWQSSTRAQWHRLNRPALFIRNIAAMLGLTTLISLVAIGRAPVRAAPIDFGPIRGLPTLAQLSSPEGLAACLRASAVLIGIVVIANAATTIAGDYERGTIRLWLTRQPSRSAHLTGLLLALAAFTAIAYTAIAIVTIPISTVLAQWQDASTDTWFTTDGLSDLATVWFTGYCALAIWLTIGAALAITLRSASLTITTVSVALIAELIISSTWRAAEQWLPITTITNLGAGGSENQTLTRAVILSATYLTIALATAYTTLNKRDIAE